MRLTDNHPAMPWLDPSRRIIGYGNAGRRRSGSIEVRRGPEHPSLPASFQTDAAGSWRTKVFPQLLQEFDSANPFGPQDIFIRHSLLGGPTASKSDQEIAAHPFWDVADALFRTGATLAKPDGEEVIFVCLGRPSKDQRLFGRLHPDGSIDVELISFMGGTTARLGNFAFRPSIDIGSIDLWKGIAAIQSPFPFQDARAMDPWSLAARLVRWFSEDINPRLDDPVVFNGADGTKDGRPKDWHSIAGIDAAHFEELVRRAVWRSTADPAAFPVVLTLWSGRRFLPVDMKPSLAWNHELDAEIDAILKKHPISGQSWRKSWQAMRRSSWQQQDGAIVVEIAAPTAHERLEALASSRDGAEP